MPPNPLHAFLAVASATPKPALIDLRDATSFMQSRLRDSYNVPLEFLVPRMFLLPDRTTPLALVTADTPEARTVRGAASAGGAKEDVEVCAFLASRGWQVVAVVGASPEVLGAAAELGALESGGDELALRRRWPFHPSQLLMQQIGAVERALAAACALPGGGGAGAAPRGRLAGDAGAAGGGGAEDITLAAGPAPGPQCVTLRMLDIGCGSGRDLAWLSARTTLLLPSELRPPGPEDGSRADGAGPEGACDGVRVAWECVGLDSWHGALARCADVLSLGGIPPGPGGVSLRLAEIEGGTGALRSLPPPPVLKPSLQKYLALGAGGEACAETGGGGEEGGVSGEASGAAGGADGGGEGASGGACAASSALEASLLGSADLVLCVRLLCRSFLPRMAALLRPGGFILYSTFVDGPGLRAFGRPQGREHVLDVLELATDFFGPSQGFEVLRNDVSAIPDGREVTMFCARKMAPQHGAQA